jgi:hypothetical protein
MGSRSRKRKLSRRSKAVRAATGTIGAGLLTVIVLPITRDWIIEKWESTKPALELTVSRPPQVTDQAMSVDSAAVVWIDRDRPPDDANPPTTCDNWPDWAPSEGAVDVGTTTLVLTIQSARKAAISIEGIEVEVTARRKPPAPGAYALCEVTGGASSSPLQMEVNLNEEPAQVHWIDAGTPTTPMNVTLAEGESEKFWLRVWTSRCDCTWRANLRAVVDGKVEKYPINDDGNAFRTVAGFAGLRLWAYDYENHTWIRTEPDQRFTPCYFANSTGAFSAATTCSASTT